MVGVESGVVGVIEWSRASRAKECGQTESRIRNSPAYITVPTRTDYSHSHTPRSSSFLAHARISHARCARAHGLCRERLEVHDICTSYT